MSCKHDDTSRTGLHITLVLLLVCVIPSYAETVTPSDTQAQKRTQFGRFSFKPPPGEGWMVERKRNRVIYRKALSTTHTVGTLVNVAKVSIPRTSPPDSLDPKVIGQWGAQEATRHMAFFYGLVKGQERRLATGRLRAISFVSEQVDTKEDKKAICRVFDATSEDRGVPRLEGRVFLYREHGLICMHYSGDWVLYGNYSERWLKGEKPLTSFHENAKAFIKTVRFDGKLAPEKPYYED